MARALTKKVGRPSDYTQELADKICAELSQGISLRTVCLAEDMPDASSVFRWLRTNEEFCKQYARATEERTEALGEEILDISDESVNDWMEVHYGDDDDNVSWKVNNEAVQRSKLRVDTRKWIMSKMKPKKYGDKVDVTSDHKPIQGNTIVFRNYGEDKEPQ